MNCSSDSGIGVKSTIIVGGIEMMNQSLALAKKPHVISATSARMGRPFVEHERLQPESTKISHH